MNELVLGGVRSGKSRLAEQRAVASGLDVVYIATATAGDNEMSERIAQHRSRRPAEWIVVEEPLRLAASLHRYVAPHRCIVVDCLTLWLTNWLCADSPSEYARERDELLGVLENSTGHIIFVSNETGLGVVPLGELSRRYCDEAGVLHQQLAAICDRVTFTVAGLPLLLKGSAP